LVLSFKTKIDVHYGAFGVNLIKRTTLVWRIN
jgi:hypothetical protein